MPSVAERRPISRMQGFHAEVFRAEFDKARRPVVISDAIERWRARTWSPRALAERIGDLEITASVGLPDHGVPYRLPAKGHIEKMALRELVARLDAGERAYLDQANVRQFPSLSQDWDFGDLAIVPSTINLWLGARTRSGLHFDAADNVLVQLYGSKHATLVASDDTRYVYPFPDLFTKSRVDPDSPDYRAFPDFARAVLWEATLDPGDVLFIPRGWWHYLRADAQSISLNAWHGEYMSLGGYARVAWAGGWGMVRRTSLDFIRYGVLRRPFKQKLYATPPLGFMLFGFLCLLLLRGTGALALATAIRKRTGTRSPRASGGGSM